ncbi:hypothetical protein GCM10027037_20940 [Mucilaginibacter koreensis]
MSAFISKLQYKNYEPGEFTDEQPRTLEETLAIIKNYPWETERYMVEVEPTCPSVTVMNELGEYLKLGPYFNHKYCLYYLDAGHHLYEMHVATLEEACVVVTSFYETALPLKPFEKHTFSIGAARHFITRNFEYTFKWIYMLPYLLMGALLTGVFGLQLVSVLFSFYTESTGTVIVSLVIFIIGLTVILFNYSTYQKVKNLRLIISRGKNEFYYGTVGEETTYLKSDVRLVKVKRGKNAEVDYVEFKNGRRLHISRYIIPPLVLMEKFPNTELLD